MAATSAETFEESTAIAKDKFARGMVDLLVPVVQELDQNVLNVRESQIELFREIERLSGELQKFVEHSKLPNLELYIAKLNNAKRRLTAINTTLKTVQERLDRIYYAANRRKAAQAPST